MTRLGMGLLAAFAGLALLTGFESGEEQSEEKRRQLAEANTAATTSGSAEPAARDLDLVEVPVFAPPSTGGPASTDGAATRVTEPLMRLGGATRGHSRPIRTLVPPTAGLTTVPRPVLYWYAMETISDRVEFTVEAYEGATTLCKASLDGPFEPGIQRIRLKEDCKLDLGIVYSWTLSRGGEIVDGGGIERIEPPAGLAKDLDQAGEEPLAFTYIRHGIWYEALDQLSRSVDAEPGNLLPRRQRAALLDQVGLGDVAHRDLAAVGAND